MLTHERIFDAISKAAVKYPLTKVSYFGSYADGKATDESDLDLLVEFDKPTVSILTIIGLKNYLEEELGISVDVIHAPLPKGAIIEIGKEVPVYGQA
jgi:predicted nucleotidyltransferase